MNKLQGIHYTLSQANLGHIEKRTEYSMDWTITRKDMEREEVDKDDVLRILTDLADEERVLIQITYNHMGFSIHWEI